jgi:hypothetical protein
MRMLSLLAELSTLLLVENLTNAIMNSAVTKLIKIKVPVILLISQ